MFRSNSDEGGTDYRMSFKKTLVVLTVMAMLLTSAVTVSAGTVLTDVAGTKYADAAARLTALGVLTGFEDGTFKPNDTITRAQFAAVAARALGLQSAADLSKVDTRFGDVPGSHWAAGYINVAVDQGLLRGYPDGTFKPESQVTYAEALAILVRALGYEPSVKGTWPTNYIVKGAELGLSKGVTVTANTPAVRGDVALMTDNSLTVDLMKQTSFGDSPKWEPQVGKNLLTENLKLTKVSATSGSNTYTKFRVTEVPKFALASMHTDNKVTLGGVDGNPGAGTFKMLSSYNPDDLFGRVVTAYKDSNDVIISVKVETSSGDVISDTVSSVSTTGAESGWTITFSGNTSKSYNFVTDSTADNALGNVAFRKYKTDGTVESSLTDSVLTELANEDNFGPTKVVAVLDGNGRIAALEAWQRDNSWIVTSVDTTNKKIEYQNTNATKAITNVADWTMRIVRNGTVVGLGDIKAGDVLEVYGSGDYRYLVATDNKVTGKTTAITAATVGIQDYRLKVNDTEYELSEKAYYSTDSGATVTQFSTSNVVDILDVDATLYLNQFGRVRYVQAGSTATSSNVVKGIVLSYPTVDTSEGTTYYVRITKTDGTNVSYPFKDSAASADFQNGVDDAAGADDPSVGDLVQIKLDSDGKVTSVDTDSKLLVEAGDGTVAGGNAAGTAVTALSGDNRTITAGSTYYITDSTVFLKAIKSGAPSTFEPSLSTWDAVKGVSNPATLRIAVNHSNNVAKVVVITNDVSLSTSAKSAMVTARGVDADGATLTLLIDGTTTSYKVDSGVSGTSQSGQNSGGSIPLNMNDVNRRDFIRVSFGSNGKIASITEPTTGFGSPTVATSVYVKSIDTAAGIITLNSSDQLTGTDYTIRYNDKTVFFDETTPAIITVGNLGAGDKVWVFDLDSPVDGLAEAIVKHDNSTP